MSLVIHPSNTVTFYHTDKNGKKHKIEMECHLKGAQKRKFLNGLRKFSKVFYNDTEFFPYLVHPVTKKPFYAD